MGMEEADAAKGRVSAKRSDRGIQRMNTLNTPKRKRKGMIFSLSVAGERTAAGANNR